MKSAEPFFWRLMKDEYNKVKTVLAARMPFIYSLLRKARIIASEKVPTAGVTENNEVVVNPKFFTDLMFKDKCFILGHEVLHAALNHAKRAQKLDKAKYNVAADAVVNSLMLNLIEPTYRMKEAMISMTTIAHITERPLSEVSVMSAEEIYNILPEVKANYDCDLGVGDEEGEVIQEGAEECYGNEAEKEWKRALVDAYTAQKSAGKSPAALDRFISDLLAPKVNWRTYLRECFREGFGKTLVSTYLRQSRKHPDFPGVKRYTVPVVHCLVDTSGSIDQQTFMQFVSELYEIAKQTKIFVCPWDAEAYDVIEASTPAQVLTKVRFKGGGGTVIEPALSKVLKIMKPRDIVVVFTDGAIYDIEDSETRHLLNAVAAKASIAVFVSTCFEIKSNGWRFTKIT